LSSTPPAAAQPALKVLLDLLADPRAPISSARIRAIPSASGSTQRWNIDSST